MNDFIFHDIQSNNQAYWLGFLAADGSIKPNKKCLEIGLSTKDVEHLEKFKKFIGSDINILNRMNHCSNNDKWYPASYIFIYSEQIVNDLAQYGIIPRKSYQNINFLENIPDKYKIPFILGYFDGDGWIVQTTNAQFGFCGNKIFIDSIRVYLNKTLDLNPQLNLRQDPKSQIVFNISTQGKENLKKFIDLYLSFQDSCDLLTRKKNIIIIQKQRLEDQEIKNNIALMDKFKESLKICPICKKIFIPVYSKQFYCSQECVHFSQRVVERPSRKKLKKMIREESFVSLGKRFNVSDKTISHWCKAMNLPDKKTKIKAYSDEEWDKI